MHRFEIKIDVKIYQKSIYIWSVLNQFISHINVWYQLSSVADPGFSIGGGVDLGGRGLSRRLHFENFICQNETSGPLGGVRRACPLDPPMIIYIS